MATRTIRTTTGAPSAWMAESWCAAINAPRCSTRTATSRTSAHCPMRAKRGSVYCASICPNFLLTVRCLFGNAVLAGIYLMLDILIILYRTTWWETFAWSDAEWTENHSANLPGNILSVRAKFTIPGARIHHQHLLLWNSAQVSKFGFPVVLNLFFFHIYPFLLFLVPFL